MHQSFVSPSSGAQVPCFDLSFIPAVLWNSGAFVSMPKLARVISHLPVGTSAGLLAGFNHKNVPAVLGIYPGFAKRKVSIPAITNDWCILMSDLS